MIYVRFPEGHIHHGECNVQINSVEILLHYPKFTVHIDRNKIAIQKQIEQLQAQLDAR